MRRRMAIVAALVVTLVLGTIGVWTAHAAPILWFNGEPSGGDVSNERNTLISQSSVYDNFVVPESSGSWTVTAVFSINMMDVTVSSADWSIRSGVSAESGDTVVASGTSPASVHCRG
jgi:hypothetical protein